MYVCDAKSSQTFPWRALVAAARPEFVCVIVTGMRSSIDRKLWTVTTFLVPVLVHDWFAVRVSHLYRLFPELGVLDGLLRPSRSSRAVARRRRESGGSGRREPKTAGPSRAVASGRSRSVCGSSFSSSGQVAGLDAGVARDAPPGERRRPFA